MMAQSTAVKPRPEPVQQLPDALDQEQPLEASLRTRGLDQRIAAAEASGDAPVVIRAWLAAANWSFSNDRPDDGKRYANGALKASGSDDAVRYRPATLRAVSSMYRRTGVKRDLAISRRLAEQAIETSSVQGSAVELAASRQEAGRAAIAAGQPDIAIKYLRLALRDQERLGRTEEAAVSLSLLAESTARAAQTPDWSFLSNEPFYADTEQIKQAVRLFDKANARLRQVDSPAALRRSLFNLGTVYENLGSHARAEPLFTEAVLMTKGLYGDDAAQRLACRTGVSFARDDGSSLTCLQQSIGAMSMVMEEDDEEYWQDDFDDVVDSSEEATHDAGNSDVQSESERQIEVSATDRDKARDGDN
jgi:tetratricopeptide (TPR) repeat protein